MQDRSKPTSDQRPAAPGLSGQSLEARLVTAWPAADWRDVNLAVAVSGGADSVALLRALSAEKQWAGGRGIMTVLHFNHGVRGEASASDARWVEDLADSLGVAFHTDKAAKVSNASEESLRTARRDFFRRATHRLGARYLATGHTADDQAETVMFRALRGSGIRGLAGIRPSAPLTESCTLVRPLLSVSRSLITDYLRQLGQAYRDDASNAATDYARNWLRHELLPLAEQRFPEARQHLTTLAEHAAEMVGCLEALAGRLLDEAGEGTSFDRRRLANEPLPLVAEAIRLAWRRQAWPEQAMTRAAWVRLAELARSSGPFAAELFPGGVRAEAVGDRLVLSPPDADP